MLLHRLQRRPRRRWRSPRCSPAPAAACARMSTVALSSSTTRMQRRRPHGRYSRTLASMHARAERLGHVGVGAGRQRLDVVAAERVRGHDDERNAAQGLVGLDAPRRLVAVDAGSWMSMRMRSGTVGLRPGPPPPRRSRPPGSRSRRCPADRAGCGGCLRDRRRRGYAGSQGLAREDRRLPLDAHRDREPERRALARRRLHPHAAAVQLPRCAGRWPARGPCRPSCACWTSSACWNSSKMRCWSAAAIPGPVSATETWNAASADARPRRRRRPPR